MKNSTKFFNTFISNFKSKNSEEQQETLNIISESVKTLKNNKHVLEEILDLSPKIPRKKKKALKKAHRRTYIDLLVFMSLKLVAMALLEEKPVKTPPCAGHANEE